MSKNDEHAYGVDDPQVTAYVFDELSKDEKAAFEERLSQSTQLQELVEQTRAAVVSLENQFQFESQSTENGLDSNRRAKVEKEIDQAAAKVERKTSRRKIVALLVAAAACVALVAIPMWRQSQTASIDLTGGSSVQKFLSMSSELVDDDIAHLPPDTREPEYHQFKAEAQAAEPQSLHRVEFASAAGDSSLDEYLQSPEGPAIQQFETRTRLRANILKADIEQQRRASEFKLRSQHSAEGLTNARNARLQPAGYKSQLMVTPRIIIADEEEARLGPGFGGIEELDKLKPLADGIGPENGGDKHDPIFENEFLRVADSPLSTFSIDVDTASYSKVRMYLNDANQLPRPDVVRIEELINYFPYDYEGPDSDDPFAARQMISVCPWNPKHHLVRVAIKGKEIEQEERPSSNLVFLLDVSGSMNRPNKLPLLKRGMKMLVDQLTENDRVAIVVYAGAAGLVLESTSGDKKQEIIDSLDRLHAGGSTNGGDGIRLAYQTALDNFMKGGTNRVILCTDGDFNVGTTGTDQLVRMVEEQAKSNIFISVLGFGMGNHNDSMLEQISNKGNGNYAFVDSDSEARKVLVEQMSGTLVTIAKDVKIQVEFNPNKVGAYRLIGYENRILAAQDFNDDTKDAGEIGAGHTVTAFYEIIPAGENVDDVKTVDDLKYQKDKELTPAADSDEWMTLKLRYKQPEGKTSKLLEFPLVDEPIPFAQADREYQFAASVASFGMLLRNSKFKGNATYASVEEIAQSASGGDENGYRIEFVQLVSKAKELAGE